MIEITVASTGLSMNTFNIENRIFVNRLRLSKFQIDLIFVCGLLLASDRFYFEQAIQRYRIGTDLHAITQPA
jgi:hypothetical protein